ncbi:MAG TPA: CDP-alcohol phosphatidyltransferase family protein, partial [Sphingomicrobium sp.]
MPSDPPLLFVPVGDNDACLFGMGARDRACRLAVNAGFECADEVAPGRAALVASMDYAWDPAWLKALREKPRSLLTLGGKPVMAHVPAGEEAAVAVAGLEQGAPISGYETLAAETTELNYAALRKRERP